MEDFAWSDLSWKGRGLDVLQGHKEWCNLCLFSAYIRKCRHTHTHPYMLLFLCKHFSMHTIQYYKPRSTNLLSFVLEFLHSGCLSPCSYSLASCWKMLWRVCVHTRRRAPPGGINRETVYVWSGKTSAKERQRQKERQRNVVMAINTNSGLSSLPSAAAVDHAGVTVSCPALHHSICLTPMLPCITLQAYVSMSLFLHMRVRGWNMISALIICTSCLCKCDNHKLI